MTEKLPLKLVVLYDRTRNEYFISAHNQSAEEAQAFADRWNPHMITGCSLIMLDQPRRHSAAEAEECRACRRAVARSAHLEPRPKFKRRHE